jgi:hypothetical protein
MWNGVGNYSSRGVQWDIVDTEAPYELVNVTHVLLMGFGSKQCFE